jgi:hypothetical protein
MNQDIEDKAQDLKDRARALTEYCLSQKWSAYDVIDAIAYMVGGLCARAGDTEKQIQAIGVFEIMLHAAFSFFRQSKEKEEENSKREKQ